MTVRAYNANYTNKDAENALTTTYSLEVKPLTITVSAEDTNIYSGNQQELAITADKAEGVLNGETLTLENAKVLGTDVAEYTTVASGYTWGVVKADGTTDSTNNYNIAVSGKLTITPAPLTVTTGSAEKVFDGAALTKNEASLEGLVGQDAGVATVKATGSQTEVGKTNNTYEITWGAVNKKNYTLTEKLGELQVTAQPIETGTNIDSPKDYKYDGDAHKWEPTVTSKDGKTTLVKDTDYTVSYSTDDFTNVTSEITVTITGAGNYTGTVTRTYQITQRAVTLTSGTNSWTYDGKAHSQETVKVSGDGFAKQEGVSYSDFASVTEPTDKAVDNTFTYTAQTGTNLNNYKVTVENGELAITQQSINPDDKDYAGIKVGILEDVYYNGKVQEQKPTVTNKDGIALAEGTDYEVSFSEDTTNAGAVTVTIAGKGNYTGTVTRTYKIKPIAITVTDTATLPYNGSDQTLTIFSDKASGLITGEKLTLDDATITGKEIGEYTEVSRYNWSVAKADSSDSTGNYTISVIGKLTITQQSINPDDDGYAGVQVGTLADVVYNGASQKQKPTVTDKKGTALVEGTDYELSYSKDTTNVGEVTVTVTGIGKYTGTVKRTYNITQRPVTFTGETNTKYYSGSKQSIDKITVSETVKNSGLVEGQTWSGLTYKAEGTEPGTYDGSFSGTLSIKSGDQDVTANYAVTKTPGKLTISKSEIAQYVTLTGTPAEKVYDGTVLVPGTATATDKNGHEVTIEYQKADGTWTTNPAEVTATDVSDTRTVNVRASVPDYYDGYVTTTETLTVTKRAITVEDSKTVDYNGQNQTLTIDGAKAKNLATGETLTLTGATVTGKNAGTYTKVADGYTWNVVKSDSSDSTSNYSIAVAGTLTIKKLSAAAGITITPNNVEEKYDGDSHYAGKASATASVEGTKVTLEYRVKGSADDEWRTYDAKTFAAVNASTLTLEIRAYADNYDGYATAEETLTINRRVVEIHTLDASKTYDGAELTTKNDHTSYYIAKDGFIGTDVVDIYCTGTITDAGSTPNTIYYKLKDGAAKNYDIKDPVLGTLIVNPKTATITAGTASKSYDGKVLTTAEFKTEGFVGDQGVVSATVNGSQLYVGSSKSSIDQSTVVAKAGTKLTNYAITYKTGTLTVTDKDTDTDKVITKTHAADTYALGKTITFTITAKNIYATAKTMTISEQNGVSFVAQDGMTIEDGKAVFENVQPGGVVTLQATHRVTEADILAGTSYKNTATVAFSGEGKTFNGEDTAIVDKAVSNLKVEKIATSSPANKKSYVLNETITYTITVTNTGNLTVKDIKVSDPKADGFGNKTVDELAPGESVIFAAEHKVTESDIQAGEVVNVATATGTDSKKDETKGEDTDTEPTDTPNAHLQVTKTAEQNGSAVDGAFKLGETISYTITVKNTGNQTVKNVVVSDPNADNFGEQTIGSLAPGESKTFTATHKVTQEDILAGSVVNTATAKGSQPDGKEIENNGSDTKTVDDLDTTLVVTKTASAPADGVSYKLGEKVAYTITVTNNGNVDYKNVVVTDAAAGFTSEKFDLAVGETKTFNTGIEHVITEDDIVSGSFTNTAKAEADPITDPKTKQDVTPSGEASETIGGDSADKKIDEGNANLTIAKTVTNEGKGTGEDGTFALGDTIEYTITVTNNGNLTAKNFTVVDENADNFQPVTITELAPGATTEVITASHVVTSADILAGKVINVATTTGGSTDDPDVKPTPDPDKKDNGKAESEVDNLDTTLTVTKTASAPADGVSYKRGEKVAYTITVTNNGNVDYKNVAVTDAAAGFTSEKFDLAVGETKTFNTGIEHVITEDDIVSGSFTNTAKAEADPITDPKTKQDVTPSGEASETIGGDSADKKIDDARPKLVLTKTSDVAEGTLLKEGDVVNYTVVVSNTGNLTLSNVKVTDKLAGAVLAEGESETIDSLEPGESATLHYSYTVTQADVVNGSVTNEVTGTAENPSKEKTDVTPGTQTDPTEKSAPSLFVSKTADKTANVKAGDTITYTITVTNNGNVDLTGVVVTDELVGFTSEAFDLAKGKTKTFTKTYTVTEDDLVAGKVENVASATAKGPKDETVDATSDKVVTETEPVAYGLKVEKTAAKGSYAAGDTITYTIKVTNTGNTTVSDITVADNKTGFSKSDVTLTPGKSEEFTTDYTVTAGDITAGKLENTATADGTDAAGNKPHGEDTNTVDNKKQVDPYNPDEPTLKREFTVEDLSNVTYNGKAQELKPVVTDVDGTVLVEGIDYELSYTGDTTNVTDTGVTVTVTGKGNYTGSVDKTYQIAPATITVVTPDASKVYDGSALTAKGSIEGLVNDETVGFETTGSVTAVDDESNGVAGNNTYTIEWANAGFFGIGGNAYTAKQSNYTVKETLGTLTVTPQSIVPDPDDPDSYKGVEVGDPEDVTYDGSEHQWVPVVKDAGGDVLTEGKDYTVTYDTADFTNVTGVITVTIQGIGSYTGTITKTYSIKPAALHIATGSATATYNGQALTSSEIRVDGLVAGDVIGVTATGSQTEVGSSSNTYTLNWMQVNPDNYTLTDELGTLTVTAAPVVPDSDNSGTTPVTPSTDDNSGTTPVAPSNDNVIDTIARTMENTYNAVAGNDQEEATDEEKIFDSENPLGRSKQKDQCWVHWYMILVAVLTAVYGLFVGLRRNKHTRRLEDDLNGVLGAGQAQN